MDDNEILLDVECADCHAKARVYVWRHAVETFEKMGRPYPFVCPACSVKRDEARNAQYEASEEGQRERQMVENIEAATIPEEYYIPFPYVDKVADWLGKHGDGANILLHGKTGAGKSTSAGYHARRMLSRGKRVKWYSLAALLDEWRAARRSDYASDVPYLFKRLETLDLLILDECDKPVTTDSTQELMFRLLEDVSNGTSRAKMWMLGNFYKGSIENIFGNGQAARRRFNESFYCGQIMPDGSIRMIKL